MPNPQARTPKTYGKRQQNTSRETKYIGSPRLDGIENRSDRKSTPEPQDQSDSGDRLSQPATPRKQKGSDVWSEFEAAISTNKPKKLKLLENLEVGGNEREQSSQIPFSPSVLLQSTSIASPALGTPSESTHSSIITTSIRKTYRGPRTYAAPSNGSDPLIGNQTDDDDDYQSESDDDHNSSKIQNVHELRAAGGNAQLMESVKSTIESLKSDDLNIKRFTLMELAQKAADDDDYVGTLKATAFPFVLLTDAVKERDPYCMFLVASLLSKLFKGSVGLAATLVSETPVVTILVEMLANDEDITKIISRKKSGVTKVAQNMLSKFISASFEQAQKPVIVSQSLMALNALIMLEALTPVSTQVHEQLLQFLDQIVGACGSWIAKMSQASLDNISPETSAVVELAHLILLQIEFLMSMGSEDKILTVSAQLTPNPILQAKEVLKKRLRNYQSSAPEIRAVVTAIVQVWIVVTSHLSAMKEVDFAYFDANLAQELVSFICDADENLDITLYSCGLLLNLTDSRQIHRTLLKDPFASKIKHWLERSSGNSTIQGYMYLVMGRLATRSELFTPDDRKKIVAQLESFSKLVEGPGLQSQIDSVIASIG